jgi:hypothetical protein
MARLASCAACARHVRIDEQACAFCGAELVEIELLLRPFIRDLAPFATRCRRAASGVAGRA